MTGDGGGERWRLCVHVCTNMYVCMCHGSHIQTYIYSALSPQNLFSCGEEPTNDLLFAHSNLLSGLKEMLCSF